VGRLPSREGPIDDLASLGLAARHEVRVGPEREARVGVAEVVRERLDADAGLQKDRAVPVPQRVHPVAAAAFHARLDEHRPSTSGRRGQRGLITAAHAVAPSLSATHEAIGFDRRMPDIDHDALDLPATGTLPVAVPGAVRHGGARNQARGTPCAEDPACVPQAIPGKD
jgi:hypothetical protein